MAECGGGCMRWAWWNRLASKAVQEARGYIADDSGSGRRKSNVSLLNN